MRNHAPPQPASLANQPAFGGLIGESAPMIRLYELIAKISRSNSPVLVLGDTGTGKELVARAIHSSGPRRDHALVPVDCSTLPPSLVESELFGYVKGAFTGADHSQQGLLQAAQGGTILLDEIGELPMFLQPKLLRALQEKEVRPVGSTERISIDVRVIAATNRDLEALVQTGTFRQDLYFRLNVIEIKLLALRLHKVDIPLLVAHFLLKFSDATHPAHTISDSAMQRLMAYDWSGNVRELENAIECAMAVSSESVLNVDDLISVPSGGSNEHVSDYDEVAPLGELERRAILHALRETGGDKIAAARHLGIGKTTLYRKLKEYARNPTAPTAARI